MRVLPLSLSNKSVTMRLIPSSWLDTRSGVWGGPKCRMVARRTRSCSGGSDVIMLGSRSYIEVGELAVSAAADGALGRFLRSELTRGSCNIETISRYVLTTYVPSGCLDTGVFRSSA